VKGFNPHLLLLGLASSFRKRGVGDEHSLGLDAPSVLYSVSIPVFLSSVVRLRWDGV